MQRFFVLYIMKAIDVVNMVWMQTVSVACLGLAVTIFSTGVFTRVMLLVFWSFGYLEICVS